MKKAWAVVSLKQEPTVERLRLRTEPWPSKNCWMPRVMLISLDLARGEARRRKKRQSAIFMVFKFIFEWREGVKFIKGNLLNKILIDEIKLYYMWKLAI